MLLGATTLLPGCCSRGRFPSDVDHGSIVTHDELVDKWRVNNEAICQGKYQIEAAPGCYVLEVGYSAEYVNIKNVRYVSIGVALGSLPITAAELAVHAANDTYRAEYHSQLIPFALKVEPQRSYYVTATFNGDTFEPRIVVSDLSGNRLGALYPANPEQLKACEPRWKPQTSQTAAGCSRG
jgi:hypothetical protein